MIGFVRLNGNKLILPFSNSFKKTHKPVTITIPPILVDKKVKEIRIIPKAHARFFEIQYTYEAECVQRNLNKNNALALDFGVNNPLTPPHNESLLESQNRVNPERRKIWQEWLN